MTNAKTQLRGNCQCCGRDQAVQGGRMSKHGYEVKKDGSYAYFSGVCSGHQFKPMQVERTVTDSAIAGARRDAERQDFLAIQFKKGEVKPQFVATGRWISKERREETIPFEDAEPRDQKKAVESAIWKCEQRARGARSWADDMEALVNRVHGTELRTVLVEGPKEIPMGEKRQPVGGKVLTYVGRNFKGQVEYTYESTMRDGTPKKFRSHTTSTAWFKYPLVG